MAFGLGRLGLAPAAFWAATPREMAAAVRAFAGPPRPAALSRAELAGLMRAFPDQ